MRTFAIEGVEHVIDCNAFTPYVYSENFTTMRDGKVVSDDIALAIGEIMESVNTVGFPPLLKMMQLFWAFEKSAKPQATPSAHRHQTNCNYTKPSSDATAFHPTKERILSARTARVAPVSNPN